MRHDLWRCVSFRGHRQKKMPWREGKTEHLYTVCGMPGMLENRDGMGILTQRYRWNVLTRMCIKEFYSSVSLVCENTVKYYVSVWRVKTKQKTKTKK